MGAEEEDEVQVSPAGEGRAQLGGQVRDSGPGSHALDHGGKSTRRPPVVGPAAETCPLSRTKAGTEDSNASTTDQENDEKSAWCLVGRGDLPGGRGPLGRRRQAREAAAVADKGDKNKEGEDGEKKAPQAAPVEVATLGRGPMEAVLRYSADLEAEQSVPVHSRGRRSAGCVQLLVEEGQRVGRGQILAELQDDEQRTAWPSAGAARQGACRATSARSGSSSRS